MVTIGVSRRELAVEDARRYTTEILDRADLTPIVNGSELRGSEDSSGYRLLGSLWSR
jgi:hypothetical protein